MIILIGSQKGGCGKSTTAVNLCAVLVRAGKDVVLVDADRQGSAANWAADRGHDAELPSVHCVRQYDNIRDTVLDLNKRYEFVVVDAAGRDSRELRTGMTAAHYLVVPFRPSQLDLDTLPALQDIVTQAKDLNPDLRVRAILSMAPTNPVVKEAEEAQTYLRDYPDFVPMKAVICDRKVYRDAMSEGRGVVEMDNDKAAEEVHSLVAELFGDQWQEGEFNG